ncbi:hypothetical protein AAH994_05870 [Weeksellaceae bacterium A-14]
MKRTAFFIFIFLSFLAGAQTLYSHLDKKTLALGEPAVFTVRIENLGGKDVFIAPKNQLLPFHFEVIKDSISKQKDLYERTVEFAIYQEGVFKIPQLDIKIGDQVQQTIPYEVEVVNTAKKEDQINDIMNNKSVKLEGRDYWDMYKFYLLGFLAVVALIFLVWQFIRYGRRRISSPVVLTNQTLKKLESLRKKKYIENGNYRAFYVNIIDITREFLTSQYHIPANVLLTDDLIEYMKNNNTISIENEKIVEDVFLRGDMVKFAKNFPDTAIMQKDFDDIKAFVKRSSKDLEFEKLRKDV